MKSVLVGSPTAKPKDYCMKDFVRSIKSLNYPDYEIAVVDNSEDPEYHKEITKEGVNVFHTYPERHPFETLAKCQNILKGMTVRNRFDYLLLIESDVFVPKDIIQKLMAHDKPVVSCAYPIKKDGKIKMVTQGIRYTNTPDIKVIDNMEVDFFDGSCFNMHERELSAGHRLLGAGLGCTLIQADILKVIDFRVDLQKSRTTFSDTYFHMDLFKLGIPDYLDTSITLEHRFGDWSDVNVKQ